MEILIIIAAIIAAPSIMVLATIILIGYGAIVTNIAKKIWSTVDPVMVIMMTPGIIPTFRVGCYFRRKE